jgi:hypothetical protein
MPLNRGFTMLSVPLLARAFALTLLGRAGIQRHYRCVEVSIPIMLLLIGAGTHCLKHRVLCTDR